MKLKLPPAQRMEVRKREMRMPTKKIVEKESDARLPPATADWFILSLDVETQRDTQTILGCSKRTERLKQSCERTGTAARKRLKPS